MEQHEKGFYKVVRQTEFFTKDLDLGLFDPFKDVKNSELLDEEEIVIAEEDAGEKQGNEANVCARKWKNRSEKRKKNEEQLREKEKKEKAYTTSN